MANIPGIFIIGGGSVQGGSSSNSFSSVVTVADPTAGVPFYDTSILRVTPDDSTGASQSTALSWWPWYDDDLGDPHTTAAGATTTTITANVDPSWTTNEWAGFEVANSAPSFAGLENQSVTIISNTSDTLTVASWPGATPTVGTTFWINEGGFSDYAPVGGFRPLVEVLANGIPTRSGSSIAQGNQGIGWEAGLIPELLEHVYTVAPYFVCVKFAGGGDTNGYASAGTDQTLAEAYMVRAKAAFTAKYPSDTLVFEHIIIDLTHNDVDSWITVGASPWGNLATYATDLAATIAWLRTSTMGDNATAVVHLLNHDNLLRAVDGAAAGLTIAPMALTAIGHAAVSADDATVRLIDFENENLPTRGPSMLTELTSGADQEYYAAPIYWRDGPILMRKSIELANAGAATASDGVMPVYILIGDSISVGAITAAYSTARDSGTLTATARDARQRIWNRTNAALEPYDAHDNSQTSGTASPTLAGEDFSLTQELMLRHPDTGFVLIKRASSGSAFRTESTAYSAGSGGTWLKSVASEHYDELADDIAAAYQAVNVSLGKQAELRGVFVNLGTNDPAEGTGTTAGADFVAALPAFVTNIRNDFGTVVDGKATPFVWRIPQLGIPSRLNSELLAIRAGLVAYAATDAQFIAQNVDDLERGSDDLHETPASNITRGQRIAVELDKIALPNCTTD